MLAHERAKLFALTELTEDGCWIYLGKSAGHGDQPLAWVGGKLRQVRRVGWEEFVGPIAEGMEIFNDKCRINRCWNPRHLQVGTAADRIRSRDRAGLGPRGERNKGGRKNSVRLTEGEARVIKKLIKIAAPNARGGRPYKRIAKIFGVCNTTVRDMDRGRIWAWL